MNDIIPSTKSQRKTKYQPFLGKYTIKKVYVYPEEMLIRLETDKTPLTNVIRIQYGIHYRHKTIPSTLDMQDMKNVDKVPLFKEIYQDLRNFYREKHGLDVDKVINPQFPHSKISHYLATVMLHGYIANGSEGKTKIQTAADIYEGVSNYLAEVFGSHIEEIQPGDIFGTLDPKAHHKTSAIGKGLYVCMTAVRAPHIEIQVNSDETHKHEEIEEIAKGILKFLKEHYFYNLAYGREDITISRSAEHYFEVIIDELFNNNPALKDPRNIENILTTSSFI